MNKTCIICGKSFTTRYSKVKTCGYPCGNELKKQIAEQKRISAIPEGVIDRRHPSKRWDIPVIKDCVICGKRFAVQRAGAHRYSTCSKECSTIRKKNTRLKYPTTFICKECGQVSLRTVSHPNQKFCSNKCRQKALNRIPHRLGSFKGGTISEKGYKRIVVWENGISHTVMEHRHIMEQKLGRKLLSTERVHHKNRKRADNDPDNLVLYANHSEHLKAEWEERHQRSNT